MRGVYSHITPGMRAELTTGLQELWEESLSQRAVLCGGRALSCSFFGVSDGIRTHDIQDHNLAL
jgi:hypothetical protein